MTGTFRHPSFDQLVDFAEGRIATERRAALQAHISICARCTTEITQLERLIGLMRTDDGEDAPSHVVARAVRLFRPSPDASRPVATLRRRVVAALQFDSAQQPLAMGVRGTSADSRQLMFSDGEHVFDVRITPTGADWTVAGQVLGPIETGRVELRGPAGVFEAGLNDIGEFVVSVPPGTYVLLVTLPDVEVEIPSLKIGG